MIPAIKKILYATDLSKNSAYAFRYAVNSAQKHDAQIYILHVMETLPSAAEGLLTQFIGEEKLKEKKEEKKKDMVRRIQERLRRFAERELKDDPQTLKRVVAIDVVSGNPAAEILRKAQEVKADVVIMGSHGKGIIPHAFLGSVSEQVLHRIRKPVFIIPLPEGETDITLGEI
ncbi:MAG: universal stress protein [Thermodesulfobacteriota bacterium]